MRCETRTTWENQAENQIVEPLQACEPTTVDDIVQLVGGAESEGLQLRAIGSGHSWSDVAIAPHFQVKPNKLRRVLNLDTSLLRNGTDASHLVHVESGITLHDLNNHLWENGLGLPNMGGHDGQTIVGAISTSTHGSGMAFGPMPETVRSIEIVSSNAIVYRIEPTNGITDPAKFAARHPGWSLIQSNLVFQAVVVGMGCMGVIYSVILEVVDRFWLNEVRELSTWMQVKQDLLAGNVFTDNEHYEVLVNPHPTNGDHTCLVTTRKPVPDPGGLPLDKRNRNFLAEFVTSLSFTDDLLRILFDRIPKITDETIDRILDAMRDDGYANRSYEVLDIGAANEVPAISMEIGFPMPNNTYIGAVEKFFSLVEDHRRVGGLYHSAPVSLRFVKAADAHLSMMNGRDTCMLEIILARGTQGGFEMLQRYENELYIYGGRPHWGQVNYLTGSHDLVESLYPDTYASWMVAYAQLNEKGTFASPFSKRVGIS